MDKFKLSICLPTYNQAEELERLLASIAPQMTSEVEVVIKDDSSNNDIERVVGRFSKRFPIRYFHGVKKGIDNAIIFLLEEAKGDFVWWIGDEVLLPDGLEKVLNVIKNNSEATFVWANFYISNTKKLTIDLQESGFFDNRNQVLKEALAGLGFISGTILRREVALTGIDGAYRNVGTEFSNLYLTLNVLSRPGKYYYIKEPILINYPATSDEIKNVVVKNGEIRNRAMEVFGFNFANILREFHGSFSQYSIRHCIKKVFGQTWRGVLVGWIGGWDTPKGKRLKMLRFFWDFPEAYVAFVLFLFPLSINKLFYKFYKIFFDHRRFRFGSNRWVEEKKGKL